MKTGRRSIRVLAAVLAALCLIALALSFSLQCGRVHECAKEDCAVCLVVAVQKEIVRLLLALALAAGVLILGCGCYAIASYKAGACRVCATPVRLKVKLSN